MTGEISEALFALLRNELNKTPLPENFALTQTRWEAVFALAERHDVAQLVADCVFRNGLLDDGNALYARMRERLRVDRMRVVRLEYEQGAIMRVFETEKIPYVLLKGAIMRGLYPESWMRTSCDLDVLVHEEDLERAARALTDGLGYRVEGKKDYHDLNLYSVSGVHLELHYNILEHTEKIDRGLSRVWDYLELPDGHAFGFRESPAFFVFHHLAHMSYHLCGGGCGVRSFLDLWVMKSGLKFDAALLDDLLSECGLHTFSEAAFSLSEQWMSGKKVEGLLGDYVLCGGCYGTCAQSMAAKQTKANPVRYVFSRLFLPYESLMYPYPWIRGRKWLLPAAEIARWGKILKDGTAKKAQWELKTLNSVTEEERDRVTALLRELDLM